MLVLPYPPSSNRYWRNVKGRMVKSREARIYREDAGWLAKSAGMQPVDHDVEVIVNVYRPRRSGDLDNRLKIVLDSLNGIAYKDDKYVRRIIAERFDDKDNPRVEVEVRSCE